MFISRLAHKVANTPFIKRQLAGARWIVRLYFNARYFRADPYRIETMSFEREKYGEIEKALGFLDRFGSVLEIGAGEGVMTEILARRADLVTGIEISDIAVGRARKRLERLRHVTVRQMDLLADDLDETYDLVVCSDVLFYLEPDQLPEAIRKIVRWTRPDGHVLLVHARVLADDTAGIPLKKIGAKTIHDLFIGRGDLQVLFDDTHTEFRLTVLRRVG